MYQYKDVLQAFFILFYYVYFLIFLFLFYLFIYFYSFFYSFFIYLFFLFFFFGGGGGGGIVWHSGPPCFHNGTERNKYSKLPTLQDIKADMESTTTAACTNIFRLIHLDLALHTGAVSMDHSCGQVKLISQESATD